MSGAVAIQGAAPPWPGALGGGVTPVAGHRHGGRLDIAAAAEKMVKDRIADAEFDDLVAREFVLMPSNASVKQWENHMLDRKGLAYSFRDAPTQDLVSNTAWGAFSAISEGPSGASRRTRRLPGPLNPPSQATLPPCVRRRGTASRPSSTSSPARPERR